MLHPPTRRHTVRALVTCSASVAVAAAGLAGPAAAAPPERGTFADSFQNVVENYCDIPGLTVELAGTFGGRFLVTPRGGDGPPYFLERTTLDRVDTNLATGDSVRVLERTLTKDLDITDNGDGTLTILVLSTGNATVYGSDGKAIARNPGQVRFEVLIDHGGTPSDPSDDEFLDFLGFVKTSTGRSDDFCAATVAAIG